MPILKYAFGRIMRESENLSPAVPTPLPQHQSTSRLLPFHSSSLLRHPGSSTGWLGVLSPCDAHGSPAGGADFCSHSKNESAGAGCLSFLSLLVSLALPLKAQALPRPSSCLWAPPACGLIPILGFNPTSGSVMPCISRPEPLLQTLTYCLKSHEQDRRGSLLS